MDPIESRVITRPALPEHVLVGHESMKHVLAFVAISFTYQNKIDGKSKTLALHLFSTSITITRLPGSVGIVVAKSKCANGFKRMTAHL
jgi:hypothetical protein